jgi:hypothetical protein
MLVGAVFWGHALTQTTVRKRWDEEGTIKPKILRADQLEYLLATLETHYKQLIASYRSAWRADDREPAHQALARSVSEARQAVQSL